MIVQALIQFVISVVQFFLALLPNVDSTFLTTITTTSAGIHAMLETVNYILPLDSFFYVVGAMLTIEAGLLLFKVIRWLIRLISGGIVKA